MLGGIGHALVSAVEEAIFFHNIARHSQTEFKIKEEIIRFNIRNLKGAPE